jgi:hypothetical protein
MRITAVVSGIAPFIDRQKEQADDRHEVFARPDIDQF